MTKTDNSAADTEFDRTTRGWGNVLKIWRLCGNAACRRARACRGNPRRCAPRNYPLLPEGVRGWFETLIVAKEAGVSFEEVRDRLEGTEEDEAFREWSAAVTASVMGYSSLPSKRTMN
jgi:hypothetical protein